MPTSRLSGRCGRRWLGGLLVAAAAAACHDSPVDPLSGPATIETVPSLALSSPLPSLPELVNGTGSSAEVRAAVRSWEASWDTPDPIASGRTRSEARRAVAAHLASVMDAGEVEAGLRSLLWAEAELGDLDRLPPELAVPLGEARGLTAEAASARREGRLADALERGLEAADLYRSVSPRAVARRLVARGQALLGDLPDTADADGAETSPGVDVIARARHLVDGASRSLADGDHLLAIQRAYYGIQVLEGGLDTSDPEADPDSAQEGDPTGGR